MASTVLMPGLLPCGNATANSSLKGKRGATRDVDDMLVDRRR